MRERNRFLRLKFKESVFMLKKRIMPLLLTAAVLVASVFGAMTIEAAETKAEILTTIIACSDFQNPSGNAEGKNEVKSILQAMAADGIDKADGLLCCGDYDYDLSYSETETKSGVDALKNAVKDVVSDNLIFGQGNHDSFAGTAGLALSGNNDPSNGAYGVFVINEDDFMWPYGGNFSEETVKKTAQNLVNYLNEKLESGYSRPIFVMSHLPLHYSMRTKNDGDGMYARYIFNALNSAGAKGLNIFFLHGHDHSNGWDDYIGGSSLYLQKGDNILIAQNSKTVFKSESLNFTYMNAGYTGYYQNCNGADDALTMSVFQISESSVEISRYSKDGIHNLKSEGKRNQHKNETDYSPDTTVYESPREVALTSVTDTTPIEDVIKPADPVGRCYRQIESVGDLKNGGKYLLYSSAQRSFMIPSVVTKSNSSGSRTGFDIMSVSDSNVPMYFGNYAEYEWCFTKSGDGWRIGSNDKFAAFEPDSNKIAAVLNDAGSVFNVVSSGANGFKISVGNNYFNYNTRGLINGYVGVNNAVSFALYEYVPIKLEKFNVEVSGKTSDSIIIDWEEANKDAQFNKYVKYSVFVSDKPIESTDGLKPYSKFFGKCGCTITELSEGSAYYIAVAAESPEGETIVSKVDNAVIANDILGDINNDYTVDSVDLLMLEMHILDIVKVPYADLCDINADNVVDSADMLALQSYLIGLSNLNPTDVQ